MNTAHTRRPRVAARALLFALFFALPAAADTQRIVLKSGEELFGELSVQGDRVEIVTAGGKKLSFRRDEVQGFQGLSGTGTPTPTPGAASEAIATASAAVSQAVTVASQAVTPYLPDGPTLDSSRLPWYRRTTHQIVLAIVVVVSLVLLSRRRDDDDEADRGFRRPSEKDFQRKGLSGCAWIALVLLGVGLAAGLYVYFKWRGWAADSAREVVTSVVAQSDLSDVDKARVRNRLQRAIADFEAERIGTPELERLAQTFARGPLIAFTLAEATRRTFQKDPRLTAAERTAGGRAIERWGRGVAEGKVAIETLNTIFAPLGTRGPDGKWKAKSAPAVEDLRATIALAQAEADRAAVPNEPWKLDVAQAIEDLMDRALGPGR